MGTCRTVYLFSGEQYAAWSASSRFACIAAGIAHWNEMHSDGMKIARPRQLYTGYEKRDFKSDLAKR
ncbi:MAG: hypothetical protein JO226_13030 [Pluralibacter sp.]|nr:hypothetical protein [Pluralibacter sp.]